MNRMGNENGYEKRDYVIQGGPKGIMQFSKREEIKNNAQELQLHYKEVINDIRQSGRTKLRFAAYVMYDSSYGMDGVFKLMEKDEKHWDPCVVIIPDVARGKEHSISVYRKTRDSLKKMYGEARILDGWDCEKDEYLDYIDDFDIIYYANPYDELAHKYHQIAYAITKRVLPIYVSYGYDVGYYTTLHRVRNYELNYVWKLFADTTYTYDFYKSFQIIEGKNVTLAGYCKMDSYSTKKHNKKKKKILLSPHHSVLMESLPMSNFLNYCDFILKLPDLYPNIDFVFRPHPLLFFALVSVCNWTNDQVDNYKSELTRKGIEYSDGGDYLNLFSECDAIINDCGSFTVEWLYTGKPGCFVYNAKLSPAHLTPLMNKAIESYDIARSERDILDFINKIIEEPSKQYTMQNWVKEKIAINYPNVSDFILKQLDVTGDVLSCDI